MEERVGGAEAAIADGRVENHDLSVSSSYSYSYYSYYDNCRCDCKDESPSILLDDYGFRASQLSSGLEDEGRSTVHVAMNNYSDNNNNNNDNNSGDDTNRSIETDESEEDSFASDFYQCGTDWSSLMLSEKENGKQKNNDLLYPKAMMRRLKQANLFQMWGFQNKKNHVPEPNISDDNDQHRELEDDDNNDDDAYASSFLPQPPNKKMKAISPRTKSNNSNCNSSSNNNKSNNGFLRCTVAKSYASSISGGRTRTTPLTDSDNNSGVANKQRRRVCPFYKKIPGTPFSVDAFCYGRIEGCNAYMLTHFHADHYGGLSKGWSHGPIYCTPLTARLVRLCLSVNPLFICPLELGTEYVIEGIKVTMLEANHCPGAALIHLCLPNGQCFLHTGDFRASKLMHACPLLINRRVNVLYLDTTYCNPKYRFPSKEDVLSFVVRVTQNFLRKQPRTLVLVGAYSIGKECVYLAIAKALGVKIYTNTRRRRILQSFGWPELSGNLCSHGKETPLHVLPMSSLRFEVMERYLKTFMNQYTAVLAFKPTGWTYSETIGSYLDLIRPTCRGIVTIYGVPYSEHSSFTELREFVQFLRPDKIIPTVHVGNAANRDKMQSYFQEWLKG